MAMKAGLGLLGGIGAFVKPGEKIVLKPNVLIGASPERCVCTHPAILSAAGKILLEAGAKVTWGDSPAVGGAVNMNLSGLKKAADDIGIELADFSHGRAVMHSAALLSHRLVIADAVLDADGVISLPKLKTHGLTRFTGAVKNQFGCVPGLLKNQQHARMPDVLNFAAMLVDINTLVRPRLYIMDAVMAMEGNGPRSGRPRKLGLLLISSDPIALDAVACKLIDLDPAFVPTSAPGENRGWALITMIILKSSAKKLKITSVVTSMSFASRSFHVRAAASAYLSRIAPARGRSSINRSATTTAFASGTAR